MQKFCKLSPYISDIYKLSGVDHSGLFIYYVHSAKALGTNREQKAAFLLFSGLLCFRLSTCYWFETAGFHISVRSYVSFEQISTMQTSTHTTGMALVSSLCINAFGLSKYSMIQFLRLPEQETIQFKIRYGYVKSPLSASCTISLHFFCAYHLHFVTKPSRI